MLVPVESAVSGIMPAITSIFQVFIYAGIDSRWRMRFFRPLLKRVQYLLGWPEFRDDSSFIRRMARADDSLRGMRLNRFDKAVIRNHKLLRASYWGVDPASDAATVSLVR